MYTSSIIGIRETHERKAAIGRLPTSNGGAQLSAGSPVTSATDDMLGIPSFAGAEPGATHRAANSRKKVAPEEGVEGPTVHSEESRTLSFPLGGPVLHRM